MAIRVIPVRAENDEMIPEINRAVAISGITMRIILARMLT
jgi:hypothetical protein